MISGFCGAAFLSVAGGSVSDMLPDSTVADLIAVYTMSLFIGPVAGPLILGFIDQVSPRAEYSWCLITAALRICVGDGGTGLCFAGFLPKPFCLFR
jgi:MFS family permease